MDKENEQRRVEIIRRYQQEARRIERRKRELKKQNKRRETYGNESIFPLAGLQSAMKASRNDLQKVRAVNAELSKKISAVSNKSQFNQNYIATQTALLREEAKQAAADYLMKEKTYRRLSDIATQGPFWTVRAFLARQPGVPNPDLEKYDTEGNQIKLLKGLFAALRLNNILLSVSTMDTETLRATAAAAVDVKDWTTVGAVSNATGYRAEKGDDNARRARNWLDETEIPDVTEATALIAEAKKLEEFLGYTMGSIATGDDDLGIRVEGYAAIAEAREQARNQPAVA